MTIGNASEVRHYTMHTNPFNETIFTTNEETDLVVLFTTDLKFSRDISNIILKANRTLTLIRRTFHSLNPHLFRILYVSLVQPQPDYLSSVWDPHQLKDIRVLENVQRCVTRLIPSFKHMTYPDRLISLYLPSLLYRRRCIDIILTFKILQGLDGIPKDEFFTINTNAARGNGLKLFKKRISLTTRLHSIPFRVVNDWNTLPESLVNSSNVLIFKTLLDELWKSYRFYIAWFSYFLVL